MNFVVKVVKIINISIKIKASAIAMISSLKNIKRVYVIQSGSHEKR